jgi:hypothetical protein
MRTPPLIAQGTRDPFCTREEVAAYELSKAMEIVWLEDGDHDLKPRKAVSGFTAAAHLLTMSNHVATWTERLVGKRQRRKLRASVSSTTTTRRSSLRTASSSSIEAHSNALGSPR